MPGIVNSNPCAFAAPNGKSPPKRTTHKLRLSPHPPVPPADTARMRRYITPRMTEPDPRRRRILFRATHRGTQETDRLIGGYVAPRLLAFTDAELDAVEALMELPDADLADWLMGRLPIPPGEHAPLLHAMFAAIHA